MIKTVSQNRIQISWDEVEAEAYKAAGIIEKLFYPKYKHITLAAIPRGGFIPAVLIAHNLKKIFAEIISYDAIIEDYIESTIIIDDTLDTGKAYMTACQIFSGCKNGATLFHKTHSPDLTMIYKGKQFDTNEWLVFPWEKS